MKVSYLKKSTGTLTATADINTDHFNLPKFPGDVIIPVKVSNEDGEIVTTADITLYISEKPQK